MKVKVNQAVILAAGRGKRILPLSAKLPKSMLTILGRPILEYQIEALARAGIKNLLIVVGFRRQEIKDYFGDGKKLGVHIEYIVDKDPKGIASSLYWVKKLIRGPFFCLLGDILVDPKVFAKCLLRMFSRGQKNILLIKNEPAKSAIKLQAEVVISGNKIVRIIEKPKSPKSNFRTCGIYKFGEEIFRAIEKTPVSELRGEVELTDAIGKLIDLKNMVYFEKLDSWDINITYAADLEKARSMLGKKPPIKPVGP